MRVLIAMGTVLGALVGAVVILPRLAWLVGYWIYPITGPWVSDKYTPDGHRMFIGGMSLLIGSAALGVGRFLILIVSDAHWIYRLEQRIKAAWAQRKRKPVPLSDLTKHMQKSPERWKDHI